MLKAVKAGHWGNAYDLANGEQDPLTSKLYLWLYFMKDKQPVSYDQLSSFVLQNPDFPRQGTLRLKAEKIMPSDLSDKDVVRWFENFSPQTPSGMERYIDSLLSLGKKDVAREVLTAWWKTTLLTPDRQRYFLERYGALLDMAAHKKRFDYLLFHRHYTNARALGRIIGKGYPQLAAARIGLAEQSGGVDDLIRAVPPYLLKDPGLLYERMRWRRRHDMDFQAMEILHNAPPAEEITNLDDWWAERHILARRLIENGQYESAYLLVEKHMQKEGLPFAQAQFLAGWLALRYMKNPWKAFEHFEILYYSSKTPVSRARGAYWAGVASEGLGHPEIAQQWYAKAAEHQTTFYGQYAISAMADGYKPRRQTPPSVTMKDRSAFEAWDIVQAARLLDAAGMDDEASRFLAVLAEKSRSPAEYRLSAELAEDMKYQHSAVKIAKEALKKNVFLMDQAYPTLLSQMRNVDLEWALVHAVIRQESAFDVKANSPAGAKGLMQLMPATAQEVARKAGLSHRTSWLTSNPAHNIGLGSRYMQQMIEKYDGAYPLAIAAYNGGPGRVDRWLREFGDPRKGEIAMIDWIETIPVYETRNYVQRVMEGTYVYRIKLHGVQRPLQDDLHIALQ